MNFAIGFKAITQALPMARRGRFAFIACVAAKRLHKQVESLIVQPGGLNTM